MHWASGAWIQRSIFHSRRCSRFLLGISAYINAALLATYLRPWLSCTLLAQITSLFATTRWEILVYALPAHSNSQSATRFRRPICTADIKGMRNLMNMQLGRTTVGCSSVVRASDNHCMPMSTIFLDGFRYLAQPLNRMPRLFDAVAPFNPLTVFVLQSGQTLQSQIFQHQIKHWTDKDDVWNARFLEYVLLLLPDGASESEVMTVCTELKTRWKNRACVSMSIKAFPETVASGPYFIGNDHIHRVWRLYDDIQSSFMLAIKPRSLDSHERFQNLGLSGDFPSSLAVAVPARSQFSTSKSLPLEGYRFAVKDLFHLEGLRTTVGCRAYYAVAEPASETVSCVRKLVNLGATLVGTLKLGSLITKEEPAEAADYGAPFNPRGDGYQSAWSSSGGSGAAKASYDWLDFTLATDTTGSSRRPALANGIFQLRVSHDALSNDGMVPSFSPFDAPSIFARDLEKIQTIGNVWLGQEIQPFDEVPMQIVYFQDYNTKDPGQQSQIDQFVTGFGSSLNADILNHSLTNFWRKTRPTEANDMEIDQFLSPTVGVNSFCYGLYHELDDFRAKYRSEFHKEPYVNPTTRWRWDVAQNVSAGEFEDAINRLAVYKKWFVEHVLQPGKRHTLVVFPITTQVPDYRDGPVDPPSAPSPMQPLWLAPILGAPEVSVPVGEVAYFSRVSLQEEHLPLVVSILTEPGKDMELVDVVLGALKNLNMPTTVKTGSRMFQ